MMKSTDDSSLKGARVLVVEDDFFVAEGMRCSLERIGCKVIGPAPNTRAARTYLNDEVIDLAVLDVALHGETSLNLARELQQRDLPVLFVTGYGSKEMIPEDLKSCPCLRKPVDQPMLQDTLKNLLASRALDKAGYYREVS